MRLKDCTTTEKIVVYCLIAVFNIFAMVVMTMDYTPFNIEVSASDVETTGQKTYAYDIPAECDPYIPTLDIPLSEDFQHLIYSRCESMDMDFALCMAIIACESSFRSDVTSYNGTSVGLMQINYCNHEWLQEEYGITNIWDPEQNVYAGIIMYQGYLARFGTPAKALMAYNAGPSGAKRLWDQGIYHSDYSDLVLSTAEQYRQEIAYDMTDYYMDY